MRGSYPAGGFGGSNNIEGMWQAMEELRSRFEKRAGTRAGKGEVRAAVLALLAERPMHGYQIIREIEERSGGSWKPSAGSVYPTLQLLADEGVISAEESNGRKIYSLTEAGREEAAGVARFERRGQAAGAATAHRVRRAAQGRRRAGPGSGAGGPDRLPGAGAAGRGSARRGPPADLLDPRPGLTGVASVRRDRADPVSGRREIPAPATAASCASPPGTWR